VSTARQDYSLSIYSQQCLDETTTIAEKIILVQKAGWHRKSSRCSV